MAVAERCALAIPRAPGTYEPPQLVIVRWTPEPSDEDDPIHLNESGDYRVHVVADGTARLIDGGRPPHRRQCFPAVALRPGGPS